MKNFSSNIEKIEFLKKYKLMPKTATDLPTFYYYPSANATPIICEIIGYEDEFDSWASISINANNKIFNIHSDYLLEMKKRGNAFYKNNSSLQDNENDSNSYVVFDLETTGINCQKDEIIEIAAIKYTSQGTYEFNELININSIVPINITLLTGITNEMLIDAEPLEIVLPRFLKFIGNCKLVGHNIKSFDIRFINNACHSLELPELTNELIDTLIIARNVLPELDNHKLQTICNYYGIDYTEAHRALADCYMCSKCYDYMSEKDTPSCVDIYDTDLTDNSFQSKILSILQNMIAELELPKKGLVLQKNIGKLKETFSIYINEPPYPATESDLDKINTTQSILNYEEKEDLVILTVKTTVFNKFECPKDIQYKYTDTKKKAFVKMYFPLDHSELYTYIKNAIYYRIKHYSSAADSFGCCSQFTECSDAKKCVHENKLYSTACIYRRNLENGKIFYGKNRNID